MSRDQTDEEHDFEMELHRGVDRLMHPWRGNKCWCGEAAVFTLKDTTNDAHHNLCESHRPIWTLKLTRPADLGPAPSKETHG